MQCGQGIDNLFTGKESMRPWAVLTDNFRAAKADPAWGIAFLGVLLLPWMLVIARIGAEVACGLTCLAFLWHSARSKDWLWLREPFTRMCLLAYAWLVLVVTPLAHDPSVSVSTAVAWARLPIFFIAVRYFVLQKPGALAGLSVSLKVLLGLVIIDTLWQAAMDVSLSGNPIVWDTKRLTGPFDQPKVGQYIAKLLLPAVAILYLAAPLKRPALAAAALLLFGVMAIILSGERAAFLTTLLGGGVAMLLLAHGDARWRKPCIIACVIGAIVAVTLYFTVSLVNLRAHQLVDGVRNYPTTAYGMLAREGLVIGSENPLTGVGLRNFRIVCPDVKLTGGTFCGTHPHNVFVEWFSEAGVPGVLIFLGMLAVLCRTAWRNLRASDGAGRVMPAVALGVLVLHFFPVMGTQSYFTNWSALLVWYSIALAFGAMTVKRA